MKCMLAPILKAELLPLTQTESGLQMQWKPTALMLLPLATMSMLAVLFVVLWQALAQQTTSINRLQQRVGAMEQSLQENPAVSRQLLEKQLQQLQRNQRELDDRISRMARQQSDLLQQTLKQRANDLSNSTPRGTESLWPGGVDLSR